MSLRSDLRVLWHMVLSPIRGKTHAERLASFYEGQAADYDDFRERLLHGRRELIAELAPNPGSTWVDIGGGTGANLEFAPWLGECAEVVVVDLCQPLLNECQKRIERNQWKHVRTFHADATELELPSQVDLITFSYSLTMIPDWFTAIKRASQLLKPGGTIGVVDFYVTRKYPSPGNQRNSWFTRSFMPVWFSTDNVYLSPDHLPFLQSTFDTCSLVEGQGRLPWVPLWRAPFYRFVGRKLGEIQAAAGLTTASNPAAAG